MPANIEQFTDGTAAFFSNREVAWHRLGTVTDGAQTAQDALKLAQLDWQVYKSESPVQVPVVTNDGVTTIEVADKYATYRDHPKLGLQGLGVVGSQYEVIQNEEAFDFLNALADESGAVFETAGSLNDGRQVFMSMKMPEQITLAGGQDVVDMYLMATTSHNGTKAFTVAVTPVRPVCSNTVALALAQAKSSWYLKHTSNVKGRVQQARESLGLVFQYEQEYQKAIDSLAAAAFTERELDAFLKSLVKDVPKAATDRQQAKVLDTRAGIKALWNAPTQANVTGTRWAAFNAVVEWADWAQPVRTPKTMDEATVRAMRAMTGASAGLKQAAFALLTK